MKYRPSCKIVCASTDPKTLNHTFVQRGVYPVHLDSAGEDPMPKVIKHGFCKAGDKVGIINAANKLDVITV
jgi:pyruvate kinase